jgi:hypothetical protein
MEEKKRTYWTEDEIIFLIKNYSDMFNSEISKILNRTETSIYVKANKLGLLKSVKHKSKCIAKRNKSFGRDLTEDFLKEISKKYKSRSEFQKNDPSAYSSARKKGILDEICNHMVTKSFSIPQIILKDIISKLYKTDNIVYNDRSIIKPYEIDVFLPEYKIGFEYNGKGWHIANHRDLLKTKISLTKDILLIHINENNRNYEQDIKEQLILNIDKLKIQTSIEEINNIVINNPYSSIYDINNLIEIAKSYNSFTEFYKKEKSIYVKILKLGLIDKLTDHMCCRRKKRKINEVIKIINNYEYLNELISKDYGTYLYVKKHKLNHLLNNLKRIRG